MTYYVSTLEMNEADTAIVLRWLKENVGDGKFRFQFPRYSIGWIDGFDDVIDEYCRVFELPPETRKKSTRDVMVVEVKDPDHAALFKLTWGSNNVLSIV